MAPSWEAPHGRALALSHKCSFTAVPELSEHTTPGTSSASDSERALHPLQLLVLECSVVETLEEVATLSWRHIFVILLPSEEFSIIICFAT